MFMNICLGLATMLLCLSLQTALTARVLHYYVRHQHLIAPTFIAIFRILSTVMAMLIIGNLAQVGIWALLFTYLNEFESFAEAFYHSAVNFASLGYGDIVMSAKHKLLGPLEAINGVLMIGISTASLLSASQDIIRRAIKVKKAPASEQSL
jgi:hypothetical protein